MTAVPRPASRAAPLLPFAALSASYFAHIGFFNPYLPLWLHTLGLPVFAIGMLASLQSLTRIFAPYLWGAWSDRTGERVRLLRYSAAAALVASLGLWWSAAGPLWLAAVLLVVFFHTGSMMALTEAAMAHLVAGDWGRYGRVRLWGSAGFLATVLAAGAWFERFGMQSFPAWAAGTLALVLLCTCWLPDRREPAAAFATADLAPGLWQVALSAPMRWFFASLLLHVMAHFAVYVYFSLYLDALGFGKDVIGALWAGSVAIEIGWFAVQGRFLPRLRMPLWLVLCGLAMALRMVVVAQWADLLACLLFAQALHALTFAAHHTACIATLAQAFPGRLRARGQALFTVVGYGIGGTAGVLVGGALAARHGYPAVFWGAAGAAFAGAVCALRADRLHNRSA